MLLKLSKKTGYFMESKTTILQELSQISQAVANINNRNVYSVPAGYFNNLPAQVLAKLTVSAAQANQPAPYSVPEGYFDGLAGSIMAKIKQQTAQQNIGGVFFEDAVASSIVPPGLPTPYSVPQGYFNSLAGNVVAKIATQQNNSEVSGELNSVADLPFIPMPYTVPQGYFDGLAGNVMAAITAQQNSVEGINELNGVAELPFIPMPYTVPQGYFDGLAGNVMAVIKAQEAQLAGNEFFEELQQLAPLLNTIGKQMPYSVPQGYFQQFSVNVTVAEKTEAKVITMNVRSRSRWVNYAAAACIAVLLGVGGFLFNRGTKTPVIADPNANVEQALASITSDEINDYLNSQPSTGAEASPTSLEDQVPDVQTDIDATSTQDIQQYLKENSEPDEKRGKDI